jgi:3-dehydroquinate synthetase
MVSVFDWSAIDHGLQKNCIGGIMVSVLDSSVIDQGLQKNCIGEFVYNPRSITLESSTLTITPPMHFFCNP